MAKYFSAPYYFDEFFASGREESISPFLTPSSRRWGKYLPLKSALLSSGFLAAAFISSFFHPESSALLLCLVYFLSGTPALINTLHDLSNLEINIDVLMTVAALLSVVIGSALEGALLLVLFELSAGLEDSVSKKTRSSLLSLHRLSPSLGCVIGENGTLFERSIKEIPPGTKLLVKAGEVVPLDGVILQGTAFVNLAHLTGESLPTAKKVGDEVAAGSYTIDGSLTIRALRTSRDSTLSRMIQLITQAQETKPRLERLLDRFGKWYALTIILLSVGFALAFPYLLSIPFLGVEGSVYRALTFLIAASPCALILATPTAYLSAISSCARKGIVLKGGTVLDSIAACSRIAFDKTGTLTTGKLECTGMEALTKDAPSLLQALSIAAEMEKHTVHPIAEAIIRYAATKKASPLEVHNVKALPGKGLEGTIEVDGVQTSVAIGHAEFICKEAPQHFENRKGEISTYLRIGAHLFVFHFQDALREEAKEMVKTLKSQMHLMMLTGDRQENAEHVAEELKIPEVYAALKPEEKLQKVANFSEKQGLIMVGDGINDAPALARATVGISMGTIGSATAVDASDVVFLNDDLSLLPWVISKAHQTLRILKQNLTLALLVILCATTPALLGIVPLWIAVILHEGGSVLVGLNSLRLLRS